MSKRIVVPLEQADEESFPGVNSTERLQELYDASMAALGDHPETNLVYIEIHAFELAQIVSAAHKGIYKRPIDDGDLNNVI